MFESFNSKSGENEAFSFNDSKPCADFFSLSLRSCDSLKKTVGDAETF